MNRSGWWSFFYSVVCVLSGMWILRGYANEWWGPASLIFWGLVWGFIFAVAIQLWDCQGRSR